MIVNDGENGNQKLELVINHQEGEDYEISLINVFKNMGASSSVFVRLICLCLILGMVLSMCMAYSGRDRGYAQATLTADYEQTVTDASGRIRIIGPDEVSFNSHVLGTAINRAGLSDMLNTEVLSSNVSLSRNLTEESSQALELIKSSIDSGKVTSMELLKVDLQYQDSYIVSLKNGFAKKGAKPVYLSGSQMNVLLDSILDVYGEQLYKTKADTQVPLNFLESNSVEDLDYVQALEILRNDLDGLRDYCLAKAELYPDYRSAKSGLSFGEMAELIKKNKADNADSLYSYVYSNNIYKDPEAIITNYNYTIATRSLEIDSLDRTIADNEKIIRDYKNEQVVFAYGDGNTTQESSVNTDYYNALVMGQADLYAQRAAIQSEINYMKECVENIETADYFSSEDVDAEMQEVIAATAAMETMACNFAKEFVDSDEVRGSFIKASSSVFTSKSFINSSSIKKAVIAGAAGAFAAVCIWGVYAFIEEIRKEEKKHEAL